MRTASILPLDFTEKNLPSRRENSILFMAEWGDLEGLLAYPVEVLRYFETRWPQRPKRGYPRVDWKVNQPVSARFECGYRKPKSTETILDVESYSTLIRCFVILGGSMEEAHTETQARMETHFTGQTVAPFMPQFVFIQVVIDFIQNMLKEGAFYVEFAPHTSSLYIKYFPPIRGTVTIPATAQAVMSKPKASRVTGDFTKTTIRLLKDTTTGIAHFDIGADPLNRARMIVNHLEDPCWICQKLNNDNENVFLGESYLIAEGKEIVLNDLDEVPLPKPFSISATNPDDAFPNLYVEELGTSNTGFVCGMAPIIETNDFYYLGDVSLKLYPPPPPQTVP